jgi:hypothetical protein
MPDDVLKAVSTASLRKAHKIKEKSACRWFVVAVELESAHPPRAILETARAG